MNKFAVFLTCGFLLVLGACSSDDDNKDPKLPSNAVVLSTENAQSIADAANDVSQDLAEAISDTGLKELRLQECFTITGDDIVLNNSGVAELTLSGCEFSGHSLAGAIRLAFDYSNLAAQEYHVTGQLTLTTPKDVIKLTDLDVKVNVSETDAGREAKINLGFAVNSELLGGFVVSTSAEIIDMGSGQLLVTGADGTSLTIDLADGKVHVDEGDGVLKAIN